MAPTNIRHGFILYDDLTHIWLRLIGLNAFGVWCLLRSSIDKSTNCTPPIPIQFWAEKSTLCYRVFRRAVKTLEKYDLIEVERGNKLCTFIVNEMPLLESIPESYKTRVKLLSTDSPFNDHFSDDAEGFGLLSQKAKSTKSRPKMSSVGRVLKVQSRNLTQLTRQNTSDNMITKNEGTRPISSEQPSSSNDQRVRVRVRKNKTKNNTLNINNTLTLTHVPAHICIHTNSNIPIRVNCPCVNVKPVELRDKLVKEVFPKAYTAHKEFVQVWNAWVEYSRRRVRNCTDGKLLANAQQVAGNHVVGKPPTSAYLQTVEEAIASMEQSMEKNWQGLFPANARSSYHAEDSEGQISRKEGQRKGHPKEMVLRRRK